MSGEHTTNTDQDVAPQTKPKQTRQRSTVPFAYIDLEDVMAVAAAIHDNVGTGDCDEHQLAVWLRKSPKSSGFRILLSTARLFGLIETDGSGRSKLSPVGKMAVDPAQAREAKAKAFLTVPLYSVVFEAYKGGVLPPAASRARTCSNGRRRKTDAYRKAGFRAISSIRRIFRARQRSIGYAGNCTGWSADSLKSEASDQNFGGGGKAGGGGGDDVPPRHPLIEGMFLSLPLMGNHGPSTRRRIGCMLQLLICASRIS